MAKKGDKKSESQKELIMVMVLSLFLGAGGFALGAITSGSDSDSNESHAEMKKDGHSHGGHEMFMVSAEEAPTLKLMVMEDKKSGYNVKLVTENFTFAPDSVNGENVVGEGHAHLYVDGEKVGRLYGPDFHYDGNFEGTKTFRATLNANMHGEYAVDGVVIEDAVEVTHDSNAPGHDEMHMKDGSHSQGDGEMHSHSDM